MLKLQGMVKIHSHRASPAMFQQTWIAWWRRTNWINKASKACLAKHLLSARPEYFSWWPDGAWSSFLAECRARQATLLLPEPLRGLAQCDLSRQAYVPEKVRRSLNQLAEFASLVVTTGPGL